MDIIFPLRKEHYEYYLYIMLAPGAFRPVLASIIAFEWELEQIQHKVSEEMLGHIRFAWWQESVDMLASGTLNRAHPVLDALKIQVNHYPELVPLLSKRLEMQQHAYTHIVDGNEILATRASLIEDIKTFLTQHHAVAANKWANRAEKIRIYAEKHPLQGPKIGLLFRLLF